MNWINARLTSLGEIVFAPLASWSPQVVLVLLSVICGIVMTFVFRYTSNQKALTRVAKQTKAHLLCLRLFKDDLGVALRCQKDLLKVIGLRLWYSVPPMLVLMIPFVLILTQLALVYENRPLETGESVVAVLYLSPDHWKDYKDKVRLQTPAGVRVETPPLRDAVEHAVYWRLGLNRQTEGTLRWSLGNYVVEKSIVVADDAQRLTQVSLRRPGTDFWDRLLRPGEPGFSADWPVEAVDVLYPRRSTPFFGFDIPWWGTFFIVSIAAALLMKPFVKVQF